MLGLAGGLVGRTSCDCLDLGCKDGMTLRALARAGMSATGVDVLAAPLDARAVRDGVRFLRMDAADLGLPDRSFDLVFSHNSFEHFSDPDAVLREAARVTRPGGFVYLHFGPLYNSPRGQHAFDRIGVPYCQHLFPREVMDGFLRDSDPAARLYDKLNHWPLALYRELWDRFEPWLERVVCREESDPSGLPLIERYPSCFRGKAQVFDEFLVGAIEILFRKRT
jgi:SAM-dependent methyltransferase